MKLISNICLALKLDKRKVVSIANEQTESHSHPVRISIYIYVQKTNILLTSRSIPGRLSFSSMMHKYAYKKP